MNKTERNAILLSLFSVIGICGIGHFYLKKYKEGILFLVGGLILQLVIIFPVLIGLYLLDLHDVGFFGFIDITTFITMVILFTVCTTRIIFIIRNTH